MPTRRRLLLCPLVGLGLGLAVALTMLPGPSSAFAPSSSARHVVGANIGSVSSSSAFLGTGRFRVVAPQLSSSGRRKDGSGTTGSGRSGSGMAMFLGTDGGVLGVGAPEIAVIVLVGYFILGPTELYKLTKEIGKTIQNFRSLSTEASKSFESTMENQLELDELRKASRELNEAFSFRRSINTDEVSDFNEVQAAVSEAAEEAGAGAGAEVAAAAGAAGGAAAAAGVAPKKRKVKRRRVKKEEVAPVATAEEMAAAEYALESNVPDLDMSDAFPTEQEKLREERMARLASGTQPSEDDDSSSKPDWFDDRGLEDLATTPKASIAEEEEDSPFGNLWSEESKAEEQDRFAAQLSGQWNDSILENEDQLGPLGRIMDRLAILEEEKKAQVLLLEEEFKLRNELEEKFYQQKRKALEEAAAEVQAEAYAGMGDGGGGGAVGDETSGQQIS